MHVSFIPQHNDYFALNFNRGSGKKKKKIFYITSCDFGRREWGCFDNKMCGISCWLKFGLLTKVIFNVIIGKANFYRKISV